MKKKILPWLILTIAVGLSSTAAFYSIIGLSKLFIGVSTAVIVMASFLEISKLAIATLLHTYWDKISKVLKIYLIIACGVLMVITSIGIYGMLSSGYKETFTNFNLNNNQKQFINQKIEFYQQDLSQYNKDIQSINQNIQILSSAKSRSIQVRDTNSSTGFRNTISNSELRLAQQRIQQEEENKKQLLSKRQSLIDSIQFNKTKILSLNNKIDTNNELGPLIYLSDLTGQPMNSVINILILVIIFVFDPLAISLILAANIAFDNIKKKRITQPKPTNLNKNPFYKSSDNVISPKVKNKIKESSEDNISNQEKIQKLKSQLHPNLSAFRTRKIKEEISKLENVKIY